MPTLCTWCQSDLPTNPLTRQAEDAAAHGICPTCFADLERQPGTQLLALVDALPHPAMAVDGDLRIRAANQPACDLLDTPWASLVGRRLLEAFGYGHTHGQGGCEVGIACTGCELHRLVQGTFHAGTAGIATVPGTGRAHHLSRQPHLIRTLRAGEMVALRLDPLVTPPRDLDWLPSRSDLSSRVTA